MSIGATTEWYIRAGGSSSNGGGYDPSISGAGTNFCDQDAAQLTLTDLATSGAGSTTLTSSTGGFTSSMVANCFRIPSGTNFTAGYYFMTAFTDSHTCTVDRSPTPGGAGSGGTGSLGGAFAALQQLANGGAGTQPSVTSPLAAGHVIHYRGSGGSNPSSPDYTQSSYYQFAGGDTTSGSIHLKGYNGTPFLRGDGLTLFGMGLWKIEGVKFGVSAANNGGSGIINGNCGLVNCIIDQQGFDVVGANVNSCVNCLLTNSGSTSSSNNAAIISNNNNANYFGCIIENWRGFACSFNNNAEELAFCLVKDCHGSNNGTIELGDASAGYRLINNTIASNLKDGIKILGPNAMQRLMILNNNIVSNSGYGINASTGSAALNTRIQMTVSDYNNVFNNSLGDYNNWSAGPHDISVDPQFANTSGGNYGVGPAMWAKGFPGAILAGSSTGFLDIGAFQHQDAPAIRQIINQYYGIRED